MNVVGFRSTASVAVVLTVFVMSCSRDVDAAAVMGSANVDDAVQHSGNHSTSSTRHLIRGERNAEVITQRLPDMKVCLIIICYFLNGDYFLINYLLLSQW